MDAVKDWATDAITKRNFRLKLQVGDKIARSVSLALLSAEPKFLESFEQAPSELEAYLNVLKVSKEKVLLGDLQEFVTD